MPYRRPLVATRGIKLAFGFTAILLRIWSVSEVLLVLFCFFLWTFTSRSAGPAGQCAVPAEVLVQLT